MRSLSGDSGTGPGRLGFGRIGSLSGGYWIPNWLSLLLSLSHDV